MLAALEPHMGEEVVAAFAALLPSQPWREAVPTHHWLRPEVVDAVAAFGGQRLALHESMIALIGEEHAGTLMEYLVPAPWRELQRLGVPLPETAAA
jgi:hypothetical protein